MVELVIEVGPKKKKKKSETRKKVDSIEISTLELAFAQRSIFNPWW